MVGKSRIDAVFGRDNQGNVRYESWDETITLESSGEKVHTDRPTFSSGHRIYEGIRNFMYDTGIKRIEVKV